MTESARQVARQRKVQRVNAFIQRYSFTTTPRKGGWAYAGPGETRREVRRGVRRAAQTLGIEDTTRVDAVMGRLWCHDWLRPRGGQTLGSLERDAFNDAMDLLLGGTR